MRKLRNRSALSILLLAIPLYCKAQVYSVAVYSAGHSYNILCSILIPFPPFKYELVEVNWGEDANGFTITDISHKSAPGDVLRQFLRVECGSEKFSVPLDSVPPSTGISDGVMRRSGDLARLVMQCTTNRGGRLNTNASTVLQGTWIVQTRAFQDVVVVHGDHFAEVQKFLEQACGKPDPSIKSVAPSVNARSLTYTPDQIGVLLNVTGTKKWTIVSVVEKQKP